MSQTSKLFLECSLRARIHIGQSLATSSLWTVSLKMDGAIILIECLVWVARKCCLCWKAGDRQNGRPEDSREEHFFFLGHILKKVYDDLRFSKRKKVKYRPAGKVMLKIRNGGGRTKVWNYLRTEFPGNIRLPGHTAMWMGFGRAEG